MQAIYLKFYVPSNVFKIVWSLLLPYCLIIYWYHWVVLNDRFSVCAVYDIVCSGLIWTEYSQPSYCLTIQYHPLWFWMIQTIWTSPQSCDEINVHSTQSPLLLSDHSISPTEVLNDTMPACSVISCGKCIYAVHSQPSYCSTIQPPWCE